MIFVLVGPSGAGKTTIANAMIKENFKKVITCTTRAPRDGENDGVDYFFKTKEEFETAINNHSFLEHVEYCGNYYGTLQQTVNDAANSNDNFVMVLDIRGAVSLKKLYNNKVITIYINRDFEELVMEILKRNVSDADKLCRISNLSKDKNEASLNCDYSVNNIYNNMDNVLSQINRIVEFENPRVFTTN